MVEVVVVVVLFPFVTLYRVSERFRTLNRSFPTLQAQQYDIYCWAEDRAVDSRGYARPNYMTPLGRAPPVPETSSGRAGRAEAQLCHDGRGERKRSKWWEDRRALRVSQILYVWRFRIGEADLNIAKFLVQTEYSHERACDAIFMKVRKPQPADASSAQKMIISQEAVWVTDSTPPSMLFVAAEGVKTEEPILNEHES